VLHRPLLLIALGAAALMALFAWRAPLPLWFSGITWAVGAALAALLTLVIALWLPVRQLWGDEALLRHAFRQRHGLSETRAGNTLALILEAHGRARRLRSAAPAMRNDVQAALAEVADALDAAALDLFYTPSRLMALHKPLAHSELIEQATLAHHQLLHRAKAQEDSQASKNLETSRQTLLSALYALEEAFYTDQMKQVAADLENVQVASAVAEGLLRPQARR